MKKIIVAVAAVVALAAGTASAAPSINGSTGLIDTPTADTLRTGGFSLGYYDLKGAKTGSFIVGVAPRWEIGVAGFRPDAGGSTDSQVNAKLSLLPETVITPGLAVGVEDIAGQRERSSYVVATKGLPFGFRLNAGVGNGRYDGVFAGLEKTINPVGFLTGGNTFPATTLIAEYDGHTMNYGARVSIIPGLKLDAGWRDHDFYVGASYTM